MGILSRYIYLLPIILLFLFYFTHRLREQVKKEKKSFKEITDDIVKFFVPKKGSKIDTFYVGLAKFTKFRIEDIFKIKILILLGIISIAMLAHATNVSIYTKDVFGKFNYYTDLLYQYKGEIGNEKAALDQEVYYLRIALENISKNELNQKAKDEIQGKIRGFIGEDMLILPQDTVANKVYNRLLGYYSAREINLRLILLIAVLLSFLPEIILYGYNFIANANARQELRFLKKLIIVNGSIKPVDFMELLNVLVDKSYYYKNILEDIRDKNKRNDVENKDIYSRYIKETKDLDLKLFYEKLDQANNYDFDQAIVNIENEFKIQKREQTRKVRKRIDGINIVGIMMYMVLIVILIMYLLVPWLQSYNMNQIM